jgi:surfeit locus 1 family protein
MEVTQLPADQDCQEQENGKSDSQRQGTSHFFPSFLVIRRVLHHEEERGSQATENEHKAKQDHIFHGGDYRVIKPGWRFWLITAAAVLATLATLSLGRWQLSRAAEKVALHDYLDKQGARPALDGVSLVALSDLSADMHRAVRVRGQWLADRSVFLDNRQMNAKPGLYVLTPLKIEGTNAVVLVQRGWVARNFEDRNRLPAVTTPSGTVTLDGLIAPPPSKLYAMSGEDLGLIRQNLDLAQFSIETGLPLLQTVSVQQVGDASEGLLREWPVVGTGVEKHYGYAFQWFALSVLIALLYVWFQIVRRFFSPRRA